MQKIKVLFVCMGNICRSPTAEGVFSVLLKKQGYSILFSIDSAGTHAYHTGDEPDARAQKAAQSRGVDLSRLKARKIILEDFEDFDYILVMDNDNYEIVLESCPDEYKDKIKFFLEYAPHLETREVPDPYYGGKYGFERVLDMVEDASLGFLNTLKQTGEIV